MKFVQAGVLSPETLYYNLARMGLTPDNQEFEQEQEQIDGAYPSEEDRNPTGEVDPPVEDEEQG